MNSTGPSGSSSIGFSTGSVVVPATSETIETCCRVSAFSSDDLPTLRRPNRPMCRRKPLGAVHRGLHRIAVTLLESRGAGRNPSSRAPRSGRRSSCVELLGASAGRRSSTSCADRLLAARTVAVAARGQLLGRVVADPLDQRGQRGRAVVDVAAAAALVGLDARRRTAGRRCRRRRSAGRATSAGCRPPAAGTGSVRGCRRRRPARSSGRGPSRRWPPGPTASGITGLTLPGMIDEPAWRGGRRISPKPGVRARTTAAAGRWRS